MGLEQIKVTCNSSLTTTTHFKDKDKNEIMVEIFLTTNCTVSNRTTLYNYNIRVRKFRCRNYTFIKGGSCNSKGMTGTIIDKQTFYVAMHNHWDQLNPLRRFGKSYVNSKTVGFTVDEKSPTKSDSFYALRATYKSFG
jgi:hypothetical protein